MHSPFELEEWLVEPELNSLTAHGKAHHVEPKVMHVLLYLASHPRRVLSKEEIIRAVWPDTFVGDDALTRCISMLRRVMDDSAHTPRFIQTVPKAGYRLLVTVRPVMAAPESPNGTSTAASSTEALPVAPPAPSLPSKAPSMEAHTVAAAQPADEAPPTAPAFPTDLSQSSKVAAMEPTGGRRRHVPSGIAIVAAVAIAAGAVAWWRHSPREKSIGIATSFRTLAFASVAGQQLQPAFSPNGRRLAYVSQPEGSENSRILIQAIGSEQSVPLNARYADGDREYSPVWSPDGTQIAFLAEGQAGRGIYLAASQGNAIPRRIFIPEEIVHWDENPLSWSPDGRFLLFPDHLAGQSFSSIYRLQLDTLSATPMTSPPPGWEGDMDPAWSPDGKFIAFIRASESAVRDVNLLPVENPNAMRMLTNDQHDIDSIAWDNNSRGILFSSDRGGGFALWRISLDATEPTRMATGTEDAYHPAVAHTGDRIAYTRSSALWSILSVELQRSGGNRKTEPLSAVISSTLQDSAPSLSSDGSHFAFQSWRSGTQQIWTAAVDGSDLTRLTSMDGSLTGSPAWEPHGDRILFDSRPDGHSHIFVVPATGGVPQALTSGNFNDILPRWSSDGRSIFFRSNRSGRWQLWRMNTNGGSPQPLTAEEGIIAADSLDGAWVYFTRAELPGLWRIPTSGGAPELVLHQPSSGYWGYWTIDNDGIYYLDISSKGPAIALYNPESRQSTIVLQLQHRPPAYSGLTVVGDRVLLTDRRNVGSHITLAERER